ncbi:MAG TPA: hypothetical protein VHD83_22685 [Puia sp.]|nr:hypothetical protein [Puia sp.]
MKPAYFLLAAVAIGVFLYARSRRRASVTSTPVTRDSIPGNSYNDLKATAYSTTYDQLTNKSLPHSPAGRLFEATNELIGQFREAGNKKTDRT